VREREREREIGRDGQGRESAHLLIGTYNRYYNNSGIKIGTHIYGPISCAKVDKVPT